MATATQEIAYKSPLDTIIQLLGNRSTDTDSTQNQQTNSLLNQLLSTLTQGSSSGTTTGTTTSTADLGALQQVFQNNIGGMSPDQMTNLIKSIFTEGSAQVPSLIGAYANSTGSRARGNSGTTLALDELIKNMSTQAATQLLNFNTQAQQTAANAASQIAANTRQTGTTQQQQQQQQQGQTQQTNQTSTGTAATQGRQSQDQTIKPNYSNIGIALGGSLLNNLLKGKGLGGLLGGGGDAAASSGLSMGAGGSPLSFGGTGAPGGITSLASPGGFASTGPLSSGVASAPTGLNNNFTGLGAAPTSQQLVQSFLPGGSAAVGGLGGGATGLSGIGGASTLGGAGGISGLGSLTNLGTFGGEGIMGAGSLLNFGGIGAGNADFLGSSMGGLGALGGDASTLAGAGGPWGISTAGGGGITDVMSGFGGGSSLGFGDFLSQGGGSGVGSLFGGVGDALSGAADWIGSFFADGGHVGGRKMMRAGYADGGGIGAPGDMRYRGAAAPVPVYGSNLFDTVRQNQAIAAGLTAPPQMMQQGNIPRLQGAPQMAVTPEAIMSLVPMLIQQMLSPAGMSQPQGGGFADGGVISSPGIFGMADGGTVRNRPNMGLPPVRQQTGAMNFTGYDNPELADFVNRGGSAAEYIDPTARAAELQLRQQMEQQAQAEAMRLAGGQAFQSQQTPQQVAGGAYEGGDPRMASINAALAAVQQGSSNPALQAQQLFELANTTQDPEVANYYRYLGNNITAQIGDQARAAVAGMGMGSSGVGEGTATGATSQSEGISGASGGVAPGIGTGASAIGQAIGAPIGLAISVIDAIGQAVGAGAATDANAPGGGAVSAPDAASSATGSAADAVGGASGIGGVGSGNTGGDEGASSDASAAPGGEGDGGGGGGGGGKIICTAMNDLYGLPYKENKVWTGYSTRYLTPAHQRGYHQLFLPLVNFGFKSGDGKLNLAVRRALVWVGKNRTQVLQDKLAGKVTNKWHHLLNNVAEKICYFFGR